MQTDVKKESLCPACASEPKIGCPHYEDAVQAIEAARTRGYNQGFADGRADDGAGEELAYANGYKTGYADAMAEESASTRGEIKDAYSRGYEDGKADAEYNERGGY